MAKRIPLFILGMAVVVAFVMVLLPDGQTPDFQAQTENPAVKRTKQIKEGKGINKHELSTPIDKAEAPKAPEWKPYSNIRPPNVKPGDPWKPGRPKVHEIERIVVGNTNAVYRNATEQTLIDIFSTELGDPAPPLGSLPDEERERIVEILIAKNNTKKTDSEEMATSKDILAQAKAEMLKYIREGGKPEDFLDYYHNELLKANRKRMEAHEFIMEQVQEGADLELVREVYKEVNKKLRDEGIKPIPIPYTVLNPAN